MNNDYNNNIDNRSEKDPVVGKVIKWFAITVLVFMGLVIIGTIIAGVSAAF